MAAFSAFRSSMSVLAITFTVDVLDVRSQHVADLDIIDIHCNDHVPAPILDFLEHPTQFAFAQFLFRPYRPTSCFAR